MTGHGSSVLSSIFNTHTLIHGALMLGMVFTPVAAVAASAGATATFGDLALGTLDMTASMIGGIFSDGGVVIDAFKNAAEGNFMPGSYQLGAHDMATHAVAPASQPSDILTLAETGVAPHHHHHH